MSESPIIVKTKHEARVSPKSDAGVPPDRPRRRPLGLRPAPDDLAGASEASGVPIWRGRRAALRRRPRRGIS